MKKAPDAFRTISEVADWLDVQAHVLRFWESKFSQVKPVKRAGGRRYYRPSDMRLIGGIKTLLHDEGMTIKGVQKILREKGVEHVASLSRPLDGDAADPAAIFEAEAVTDTAAAPAGDIPAEAENIVTFQSRKARRPAEHAIEDPAAAAAPEEARPPEAEPQPEPEPQRAVASAEPDLFDDLPDEPRLPSFLHRSARPAPEPEPEPEEAAEPGPPRPRIVDAPDPPPEEEIAVGPGPLGRLARLVRLPPANLDLLQAVAEEIRARSAGRSAGNGQG